MKYTLTARHFKVHDTIKDFADKEMTKLERFYDGIIKAEVILSYERASNSVKTAEIIVHANHHHTFTAKEHSDEFHISIEEAAKKVVAQLKKYNDKLKAKH